MTGSGRYLHSPQARGLGITFITLRRRTPKLRAEVATAARSAWRAVTWTCRTASSRPPGSSSSVSGYPGTLRQLLIGDLGHEQPAVLLTNDLNSSLKAIITRYARRMLTENGLADAVDFFHLDALSSAVALNVDFAVLLTVIANGLYRAFAKALHGYDRAMGRQIFCRILDTSARVTVTEQAVTVQPPRRAHNPPC